jgi:hypothetical protein
MNQLIALRCAKKIWVKISLQEEGNIALKNLAKKQESTPLLDRNFVPPVLLVFLSLFHSRHFGCEKQGHCSCSLVAAKESGAV